jgi:hypothetical protein
MKTKTINVYQFSELDEQAKERARQWFRAGSDYSCEWEYIQEDAKNVGLIIERLDQYHANKGRFERFAEDTAERILKEHGESGETHKTAKVFLSGIKALKRDEDGELYLQEQDKAAALETEFLHDLLEDYRIMLEKEIEYQNSDEQVDENIVANEYEFTADGRLFKGGN